MVYGLLISRPRVRFLQIGSNDVRTGDPLWTFRRYSNWQGVLVEPVESVFRRLRQNYAPWADRFEFERAAVAEEGGMRPFYRISEEGGFPAEADQLGSLDERLVRKHARLLGGADAWVTLEWVPCLTLRELCEKHEARELDLLHVDAEGLDHEVLRQVDWECGGPAVVLYEHVHLSDADRRGARSLLDRAGYEAMEIGSDTLAVSRDALERMPRLRRAWRVAGGLR